MNTGPLSPSTNSYNTFIRGNLVYVYIYIINKQYHVHSRSVISIYLDASKQISLKGWGDQPVDVSSFSLTSLQFMAFQFVFCSENYRTLAIFHFTNLCCKNFSS